MTLSTLQSELLDIPSESAVGLILKELVDHQGLNPTLAIRLLVNWRATHRERGCRVFKAAINAPVECEL